MKVMTVSVSVNCSVRAAYAYVSNVAHLPHWASAFIKSVRRAHGGWTIVTPQGQMAFRFVAKNDLGVLDHFVKPTPDSEVYVPMRVISNGDGAEVQLTVFRQRGMSAGQFKRDQVMVRRDLLTLKRILES